ncbi:retrovirus-related Pol polyprotein from transposon opus [Trichonephila clavipes]|nr:retrovirus-related Pol polyprotein from transposon opus [Trichonephila clavipes]
MVDASDNGIGAAIQQLEHGIWKPLSFFSRKLTDTKKRYSTYDRELFAAYPYVKYFKHFSEDGYLSQIDELYLQPAIDYEGIEKAREIDDELKEILSFHTSSLKLEKVPIFSSNFDIFCDCSAEKKRPYIPETFRRIVFNNIHNLAHPGIIITTKLFASQFVFGHQ